MDIIIEAIIWIIIGALPGFYVFFIRGYDTRLGAIIGAVRGDVFWGYGDIAEEMAGRMKSKGRYWVLLPKALQP